MRSHLGTSWFYHDVFICIIGLLLTASKSNRFKMKSDFEIKDILNEAIQLLTFPSEIDAPFEITSWDKTNGVSISSESILRLTGNTQVGNISETNLPTLFSTPTMDQDWHSPADKENVKRFRALEKAITENLKEIIVYRCGNINIDVYITGRTPAGNILCVSTKQLQT